MACGPCKIILDGGGVLPASANLLADTVGRDHPLYAPARYLAAIAAGSVGAIREALDLGKLTAEQIDEAHAWSELNCHRAKDIRDIVDGNVKSVANAWDATARMLRRWAEEDRMFTTRIIGGEYKGAWIVDGVIGIKRQEK